MAQHELTTHPLVLRRLTVVRTEDITPRMRRITLGGPELAAFEREGLHLGAFHAPGFDDHVKVLFATDGDVESVLPIQRTMSIDWPPAENRAGRDYTPRRLGPGELVLDFVRHGDGPAARWAESAKPGDTLHIVGPKSSVVLPASLDAIILAGDETALPAIGRYLDERPNDAPAHLVIELRDPSARQELALGTADTITWLLTPEDAPSRLTEAVQNLAWPDGAVYVWAAGESRALLPLRRWLARDRGLPKSHISVTGYWHARDEAAEAATRIDPEALLSPAPWFATRAAVRLGILDRLDTATSSAGELAAALDIAAAPLHTILDYLASVDVLERAGEHYALGSLGRDLLDDDHLRESVEDGLEGRALSALAALEPALRGGDTPYARVHGHSLREELDTAPAAAGERVESVLAFSFVGRALPAIVDTVDPRRLAVTGPAAAICVDALASAERTLTAVDSPVALAALLDDRPTPLLTATSWPEADLALSALALADRTDAEACALLGTIGAHAPRLLIIESYPDPIVPSAHDAEHALLELAATGRAPRDTDAVTALAAAAGWVLETRTPLGWGYEALLCRRTEG